MVTVRTGPGINAPERPMRKEAKKIPVRLSTIFPGRERVAIAI